MLGPGKYGARAEVLLREVDAELVVVITIGGRNGSAFDVATQNPTVLHRLPAILRDTATKIEDDLRSPERPL